MSIIDTVYVSVRVLDVPPEFLQLPFHIYIYIEKINNNSIFFLFHQKKRRRDSKMESNISNERIANNGEGTFYYRGQRATDVLASRRKI